MKRFSVSGKTILADKYQHGKDRESTPAIICSSNSMRRAIIEELKRSSIEEVYETLVNLILLRNPSWSLEEVNEEIDKIAHGLL